MAPQQQGLEVFFRGGDKRKQQKQGSRFTVKLQRSDSFLRSGDPSRFGLCPICAAHLPVHTLQMHAEQCNGPSPDRVGDEGTLIHKLKENETSESRFGTCPLCDTRLLIEVLQSHAEHCNGRKIGLPPQKPHARVTAPLVQSVFERDIKGAATAKYGTPKLSDCLSINKETINSASAQITSDSIIPWWKQAKKDTNRIDNPIEPTSEAIPGLYLFENFITTEEEATILAELDGTRAECRHEFLPWKQAKFNGSNTGKRWGVHCNLRDRRVDAPEHPMPQFFDLMLKTKLMRVVPMAGCIPNEANAIDYRRSLGHWLKSHVDDRQLSKEPIANLSIAGDCYMTFRNERTPGGETRRILLKRRTLQVLTGKARYDYSHGIRNQDLLSDRRVSVTMRESPLTRRDDCTRSLAPALFRSFPTALKSANLPVEFN